MAVNTTRLGLLKKDPVVDGNDTFNIKTMLNDNWDALDTKVETITGAQTKADAARDAAISSAVSTAATDATNRANTAETNAKNASVLLTQKGVANGVASLNSSGQVAQTAIDALAVNGKRIGNHSPGGTSLTYTSTTSYSSSLSAIKVYGATAYVGGGYRVFFRLKSYNSNYTAYAQVYVNGSPVGSVWSTNTGVVIDFNQDIFNVPDNSSIDVYGWCDNATYPATFSYCALNVALSDAYATSGISKYGN